MITPPKSPKRLLIGAGSFADAQAALRLTEQLAETFAGDFGGLLVEETVVTEVVDLPGQRVVTLSGTLLVAPSSRQVRSLIESDAKAFRETLSGLARAKTRKWSFERRQGDLISGLCEMATDWDLVLLGHRKIHRRTGRVVLIAPPGAGSQDAMNLAENLAKALRTDLRIFSLGAEHLEPDDRRGDGERFSSKDAMLARLNRTNASVVVLDLSAGPFRTQDHLRYVLAAARCPVLVLGAANRESSMPHKAQISPASGSQDLI